MTEGRQELDSYSFNHPGLFRSKGHLHNPFEGMLRKYEYYMSKKSVVHGNLKPFAEPTQVVRERGAADLHPLSHDNVEFVRTASVTCDKYRRIGRSYGT